VLGSTTTFFPYPRRVPVVSRFYGIVVLMYYSDHDPPHFHVRYSGRKAAIAIEDGRLLAGSLPPRARALVAEWAKLHQDELLKNWERARRGEHLKPIPPLE